MEIQNKIQTAVTSRAASQYEEKAPEILQYVNQAMEQKNIKSNLIGGNDLSVMYDNHENHVKFMTLVFKLNDFYMLDKTMSWVIHSYESRGFSEVYFQEALNVWQEAVSSLLQPNDAYEINQVYDWMLNRLKTIDKEEKDYPKTSMPPDLEWTEDKNKFLKSLIKGDHRAALQITKNRVKDISSLKNVYLKIIKPAMYEIGGLWEVGHITVAHEHLATAIVLRVMASLYSFFSLATQQKGKIIISASANESHEIGARMIADLLEADGWDVLYLGANVPNRDIIKTLDEEDPDILGVSVTMSYNVREVMELLKQIRSDKRFDHVKIMVGGYGLQFLKDKSPLADADAVLMETEDAINTANGWQK